MANFFLLSLFAQQNNLVEQNDIEAFVEKMRAYAGWEKGSKQAAHLKDVEATFYECVQDQIKAEYLGRLMHAAGCVHTHNTTRICYNNNNINTSSPTYA